MLGHDFGELSEDGSFQGENFGHGFDYEVDVSQVGNLGGRCEKGASGVGGGLGEAIFLDVFGEEGGGEGEAFVERGRGAVDEGDGYLGALSCYKSDAQTLLLLSHCVYAKVGFRILPFALRQLLPVA